MYPCLRDCSAHTRPALVLLYLVDRFSNSLNTDRMFYCLFSVAHGAKLLNLSNAGQTCLGIATSLKPGF